MYAAAEYGHEAVVQLLCGAGADSSLQQHRTCETWPLNHRRIATAAHNSQLLNDMIYESMSKYDAEFSSA